MARRQNLTPDSIDALVSGRIADPQTQGLWIVARANGRKIWTYRRRVVGSGVPVKKTLGHYPQHNIAAAREWAAGLNALVEAGVDPRELEKDQTDRENMTVSVAHGLYMEAVREGRASRAKRPNKPRTIAEQESFHALDMIFEGLANLRPRRLMELLIACKSIKVKRLFFLFADRHDHAWLSHPDRAAIDLGSGPRSLVEGGKLNFAYQLMVPREFAQAPKREPSDGA